MNQSLGVVFRYILIFLMCLRLYKLIMEGRVTRLLNMDCHRQLGIKPQAQVPCRRHRSDSCSPNTKAVNRYFS